MVSSRIEIGVSISNIFQNMNYLKVYNIDIQHRTKGRLEYFGRFKKKIAENVPPMFPPFLYFERKYRMRGDTTYNPILRKDKERADGSMPIMVLITKHSKKTKASTGHSCLPEEWDESNQRCWVTKPRQRGNDKISINPKARRINAEIDDLIDRLKGSERQLRNDNTRVTSKKIKERATDTPATDNGFLAFFEAETESSIKLTTKFNTYRTFVSTLNLLKEYQKTEIEIDFLDFIYWEKFKLHLLENKMNNNTIQKHFQRIKKIWKAAKSKKLTKENPFENLELKGTKTKGKESLEIAEIIKIMNAELPENLIDIKNVFLFQFFSRGMRVGDALTLKWKNIIGRRLVYTMRKNKKLVDMELNTITEKILAVYRSKQSSSQFIFPFIDGTLEEDSNIFEKKIQSKTGIVNKG